MTLSTPIRKIYQGIADRRQMYRMFDRHSQRPDRWRDDADALYAGEWFEIGEAEHDAMFELLPPLWMRGDMFALSEYLTGSITSIFFNLTIDGRVRYFHGYCDLSDRGSPGRMALAEWLTNNSVAEEDVDNTPIDQDAVDGDVPVDPAHGAAGEEAGSEGFREAAE